MYLHIQQDVLTFLFKQGFILVTDKSELLRVKNHFDDFYESINILLKKYNHKHCFWAYFSLEPNGEVIELDKSNRIDWLGPQHEIIPGDKVMLGSYYNGTQSDEHLVRRYLKYRHVYEVLSYEVGNFVTQIYLKEFPKAGGFNSLFFCPINQEFTEFIRPRISVPIWVTTLG